MSNGMMLIQFPPCVWDARARIMSVMVSFAISFRGCEIAAIMMPSSEAAGPTGAKPTYFFLERYMPAYAAEWADFVQVVDAGGDDLPVTLADGVSAMAMAEAATLSLKTGSTVTLASVLG